MGRPEDFYDRLGTRRRAVFQPRRTDNLIPEASEFIGKEFTFECHDFGSEDDDPYPGQYRWWPLADDEPADIRGRGRGHPKFSWWVPEEDLR